MNHKRILVIADPAVDLYMRLSDLEEMQIGSASPESELFAGGTGGNTAGALAKLGFDISFFGAVGADAFGHFFKQELADIGVDVANIIELKNAFTLLCSVAVTATGERYFSIFPAKGYAAGLLRKEHRPKDILSSVDWVHASGSCLSEIHARETLLDSMHLAVQNNLPISLDLNLRPRKDKMPDDYLQAVNEAINYADYVLGSAQEEFFPLTGFESPEESARAISSGKRTVIARLGKMGSLAVTVDNNVSYMPAFPVDVVDTLGAGDVYDAGFIAACIEKKEIEEALRWGNALAALSIANIGSYRNLDHDSFMKILER